MRQLLAALLLLASTSFAQSTAPDPPHQSLILKTEAVALPAYSSSPDIAHYATATEYAAAMSDKSYALERIVYPSDGLTGAYIYRSRKTSTKLPAIIFNRGNYVVHDQAPVLLTMFHRLAQQGFVVIAPMLRGSDGTTGKDEMGGNDLHDLLNVIPAVRELPYVNADQLFMYGESRGGVMTLLALREGVPIKAAAAFGAITDMAGYLDANPPVAKMAPQIWPGFENSREEVLKSRSAQSWPEMITTPILLMHGAADKQVAPVQTLQMAEALSKQGSNYGLIIYPGDNHILSHHRVDRDREVVSWFKSFLIAQDSH